MKTLLLLLKVRSQSDSIYFDHLKTKFVSYIPVSSTSKPLFTWFRDDLPIESSGRYAISQETETDCRLLIRHVEFVDQAEWKCVAKNEFGSSITSSFLKLEIPRHYKKPRFLECLSASISAEGAVNLECKVIGVPQPTLKYVILRLLMVKN